MDNSVQTITKAAASNEIHVVKFKALNDLSFIIFFEDEKAKITELKIKTVVTKKLRISSTLKNNDRESVIIIPSLEKKMYKTNSSRTK